jgi:hypothetical protein
MASGTGANASARRGLLGPRTPHAWRVFWTQQHGDNNVWEVVSNGARSSEDPRTDAGDQ